MARVRKRLPSGQPHGGIHVHSLERENLTTKVDGRHYHVFRMPDGMILLTREDGGHAHKFYDEAGDGTDWAGTHSHEVILPSGDIVRTSTDGEHGHSLQVSSTAFDGPHVHTLRLPTGETIESLQPGQMWVIDGRVPQSGQLPAPSASELAKRKHRRGVSKKIEIPEVLRDVSKLDAETIPDSLKAQIPAPFRWWEMDGGAARKRAHRALVESEWIRENEIAMSPEGPIKVVIEPRLFKYVPEDPETWTVDAAALIPDGAVVHSPFMNRESWRTEVERADKPGTVIVLDPPDPDMVTPSVLASAVKGLVADYLVSHDDTPEARRAFSELGEVFKLRHAGAADRVFVASFPVDDQRATFLLENERREEESARKICGKLQADTEKADKVIKSMRIAGVAKGEEERIVYGIVMEPDTVDSQGDTVSADVIRTAAHGFMQDHRHIGLQHQTYVDGKVAILESFIAPTAFKVEDGVFKSVSPDEAGDDVVRAGSWVMAARFIDNDLWDAVKSGKLTGWSIGGRGVREPV